MTHGSLFSGIGGFDLAAEWMGWENKFHCEWNKFGQQVLKHYWPNAESFEDITKTKFTKYEKKIDVLTGGFPCQPYSLAGKRRGKDDERHLWPQMCRAIKEIQPRWIVGENVFGLVNWSGGLVFNEVQTDLEAAGYEVWPYVLPAAAVNAPHRRDRIWFVAHARGQCNRTRQHQGLRSKDGKASKKGAQTFYNAFNSNGHSGNVADTNSNGRKQFNGTNEINPSEGWINALGNTIQGNANEFAADTKSVGRKNALENTELERGRFGKSSERNAWHSFPSVAPICVGNDGFSNQLDGITFSKWRQESIKAAGNAIVPQVALQIFKAIEEYENLNLGTGETEHQ